MELAHDCGLQAGQWSRRGLRCNSSPAKFLCSGCWRLHQSWDGRERMRRKLDELKKDTGGLPDEDALRGSDKKGPSLVQLSPAQLINKFQTPNPRGDLEGGKFADVGSAPQTCRLREARMRLGACPVTWARTMQPLSRGGRVERACPDFQLPSSCNGEPRSTTCG
ncbi:hypothetical protein VTI74DRAFT_4754 [Chaetomium olivicolor]